MIQKVGVNPVLYSGNSPVLLKQENSQDNKPREFDSNFYVDKKGASAIKAKYFVASKYPAERKPISFDEYMEGLKRVPGQDYDVTLKGENGSKGAIISIYYKRGDVEISKNHHWINGLGSENYNGGFETMNFKDPSKPTIMTAYDKYQKPEWISYSYDSNIEKHLDLLPKDISLKTTPGNYEEYLKSNNIDYIKQITSFSGDKSHSVKFIINEKSKRREIDFYDSVTVGYSSISNTEKTFDKTGKEIDKISTEITLNDGKPRAIQVTVFHPEVKILQ